MVFGSQSYATITTINFRTFSLLHKETQNSLLVTLPFPPVILFHSSPRQLLLSVSLDLPILDISYKQKHEIQMTLERHGFELYRSTNVDFFSIVQHTIVQHSLLLGWSQGCRRIMDREEPNTQRINYSWYMDVQLQRSGIHRPHIAQESNVCDLLWAASFASIMFSRFIYFVKGISTLFLFFFWLHLWHL